MNPDPLVFTRDLILPPPTPSDKTADVDRLLRVLEGLGFGDAQVPLFVAKELPEMLRRNNFAIRVVLSRAGNRTKVLGLGAGAVLGLAIDIGSTNIDCSLFDLESGKKIDEAGIVNPQVVFGSDVLTRAQLAMTGEDRLHDVLLNGINGLILDLCGRNQISRDEIFAVTVAGNTIMAHFFLGLDVRNIPLSPYIPVVNRPLFLSAGALGLAINSRAVVYVFPNAGSYVGGDIISGIICAGINREEEPVLFIDVGTNVEITLGFSDWIMVGAGAAGPALEGGVAAIGKKAEKGTISRVKIDRATGNVEIGVISGGEPEGICGSGMIDLVSELFSAGIIDQAGRFRASAPGTSERAGMKMFTLHSSEGKELAITEKEIDNFLLSKAAMFSFLYVFVKSVGLTFGEIRKVFVAGSLGCGIDPESAINIGMLPDIPRERFISLGNASLKGAEMVLMNADLLAEIEETAAKITYREMNEDAELMSILQGAMFIPHTEPGLLKA